MNCASVKAWMRERFDQGLALEDGFEPHLEGCERCRTYVARLRAVEAGLSDLPYVTPSEDLETVVVARLRASRREMARGWIAGPIVVIAIAFVALGWRLPLESYVADGLTQLAAWRPELLSAGSLAAAISEWGRETWTTFDLAAYFAGAKSPWFSGGSIAVLAAALVGFNALVRHFGRGSRSDSLRRAR